MEGQSERTGRNMKTDFHRRECSCPKGDFLPAEVSWGALLDWAVYHAPGSEEWQHFRKKMEGRWGTVNVYFVLSLWLEEHSPAGTHSAPLEDLVRTVNLSRALRGLQSRQGEIAIFREEYTPTLRTSIKRSAAREGIL